MPESVEHAKAKRRTRKLEQAAIDYAVAVQVGGDLAARAQRHLVACAIRVGESYAEWVAVKEEHHV